MTAQSSLSEVILPALPRGARFLAALNVRAFRTGVPIFAGFNPDEKARRRAAGKRQRAARRVHRSR
ncbi:hypothetical protein JNUCC0626_18325 [Lentzea sp. JNUCC 0626]|uniref:hypothetical protein n=1 Tax=Lentzea sp. JNUCC 0626 TaxID=3367513 RepID=UPI003749C8B2